MLHFWHYKNLHKPEAYYSVVVGDIFSIFITFPNICMTYPIAVIAIEMAFVLKVL